LTFSIIQLGPEIIKAMKRLNLNQSAAAERMGIPQSKVSALMRGDFTNLFERKLMDSLNRIVGWLGHVCRNRLGQGLG
jgi:predicted XRE-type DNA-binding protein